MKYGAIYNEDFLSKFGKYEQALRNLEMDKEYEVDVEKIAKLCEITVKYEHLDVSGSCVNLHSTPNDEAGENENDNESRVIRVNKSEIEYRQRFTIAHELGHIILGHEGISFRDASYERYEGLIERMNEVTANSFAAELLMPETLLRLALEATMKELNYDPKQKFSESDVDYLAINTAIKMNVSKESMDYRLENLNIFQY